MAKIKQGILGGFSGKVAGVVGTSWKGRAVMKSRPLSVANPRTDAQQEQRGKFSKIAELASKILTTFLQPVENPISGDVSGYNKFVKDNKAAFDASGELVAANFGCGGGKLPQLNSFSATANESAESVDIAWINPAGTSALRLTDKVYAAAFRVDGEFLGVISGTKTRNDGSAVIEFVSGVEPVAAADEIVVIAAAVSADGRDVSVFTTAAEVTISD